MKLLWGRREVRYSVGRKRKGDTIDTEELKSLKHTKHDESIMIGSVVGDMQVIKP